MLRWWNWYTCTLEVRMPSGLRVRVPSSAFFSLIQSLKQTRLFQLIYLIKWDPGFIFNFHLSLLCFILGKSNLKWIWFIVVRLILFSSIYKMRFNKFHNKLQQIHLRNFKKRNNYKDQKHKNRSYTSNSPTHFLKLIKSKKGSCDSERQNKNLNNRNTDRTYC